VPLHRGPGGLIQDLCRPATAVRKWSRSRNFAVRGRSSTSSPVYRHPVRIELFGDEVESLRLYDAATQRTLRPIDRVALHPCGRPVDRRGRYPVALAGLSRQACLPVPSKPATCWSNRTRPRTSSAASTRSHLPLPFGSFFDYLAPRPRKRNSAGQPGRRAAVFPRARERRASSARIASPLDAEEFLLTRNRHFLALCAWSRLETAERSR